MALGSETLNSMFLRVETMRTARRQSELQVLLPLWAPRSLMLRWPWWRVSRTASEAGCFCLSGFICCVCLFVDLFVFFFRSRVSLLRTETVRTDRAAHRRGSSGF